MISNQTSDHLKRASQNFTSLESFSFTNVASHSNNYPTMFEKFNKRTSVDNYIKIFLQKKSIQRYYNRTQGLNSNFSINSLVNLTNKLFDKKTFENILFIFIFMIFCEKQHGR